MTRTDPSSATQVKVILVFIQFLILVVNFFYGMFRWLNFIQVLASDELWLVNFRNFVILFMTFWLAVSFYLIRKFEFAFYPAHQESPDFQQVKPERVVLKQKPLTEKGTRGNPFHRWRKFEISVFVSTAILGLLNTVRVNAFYPYLDFGPAAQYFLDRPTLNVIFDRLVEVDILALIFYVSVKIPLAAGALAGTFNRLYIGRFRVHESVFGILWILLGSTFVLYGEFFDRALGIMYILMGAFFLGRDYLDVQRFKFIKVQTPPKPEKSLVYSPED